MATGRRKAGMTLVGVFAVVAALWIGVLGGVAADGPWLKAGRVSFDEYIDLEFNADWAPGDEWNPDSLAFFVGSTSLPGTNDLLFAVTAGRELLGLASIDTDAVECQTLSSAVVETKLLETQGLDCDGCVEGSDIAVYTIGSDQLKADLIYGPIHVVDGSLTGDDIAAGSIGGDDIAPWTIGLTNLQKIGCGEGKAIQAFGAGSLDCIDVGISLPFSGTVGPDDTIGLSIVNTSCGFAIRGVNTRTDCMTYAGYFSVASSHSAAVYGTGPGTGILGHSDGQGGTGVRGEGGPAGTGVHGVGHIGIRGESETEGGYGVWGTAGSDSGRGIWGHTAGSGFAGYFTAEGDGATGVHIETHGDNAVGVRVTASGEASTGAEVWAKGTAIRATATDGDAIYAESHSGLGFGVLAKGGHQGGRFTGGMTGVEGVAEVERGIGVVGSAQVPDGIGVRGVAQQEDGIGGSFTGGPGGLAGLFDGDVEVRGWTTTDVLKIEGGADISEGFDISPSPDSDGVEPGMVVVIDPENPGDLRVSTEAYDSKVAGIVSGAGGVHVGLLMGQESAGADGAYPVAVVGRVYCLADASHGAIEPGDLLTTSPTPGHAMKVTEFDRAQGAVLGKAMSRLDAGTGEILVLVNLQ